MSLFPLFLKLTTRRCLVVGAGQIAEGKIGAMIESEAIVTVVAPHADPRVEAWAASGEITLHRREYVESDVEGMFLLRAGAMP